MAKKAEARQRRKADEAFAAKRTRVFYESSSIETLGLHMTISNRLYRLGITKVGDLTSKSESWLRRNNAYAVQIDNKLAEGGFQLAQ